MAQRLPGRRSPTTAVLRTGAILVSAGRHAQRPLRGHHHELAWKHPLAAVAALVPLAESFVGRSVRGTRSTQPKVLAQARVHRPGRHEAAQFAQQGRFAFGGVPHGPGVEGGVHDGGRDAVGRGGLLDAACDGL